MDQKIHIALTFDDGFWAPAYATMRSICLASRRQKDLVFHLIHVGLKPDHRARLVAIAEEFGATLDHIELDQHAAYRALVAELPIAPPFTPIIYARLLLDKLLPQNLDRVIYLDCDTLARAPLEALAELDLAGKPLAAVLDTHRHYHMRGRDLTANADLFDYDFAYFNSGVLVIDPKAFARFDLPGRTKALHKDGVLKRIQYDQAVLNLVFKDNWHKLDFRWNLTNPLPAHEVLDPHIVHYTGPRKPWNLVRSVAFAQIYRHAMTNAVYYQFMRERLWKALKRPFRLLLGGRR